MKNYFSAQELDDLHLSSLPSCKRLINIRAKKENWPFRARKGKGGGKEYNIDDLPSDVKTEILKNQQFKDNTIQQIRQEEALPVTVKKSLHRLIIWQKIVNYAN